MLSLVTCLFQTIVINCESSCGTLCSVDVEPDVFQIACCLSFEGSCVGNGAIKLTRIWTRATVLIYGSQCHQCQAGISFL